MASHRSDGGSAGPAVTAVFPETLRTVTLHSSPHPQSSPKLRTSTSGRLSRDGSPIVSPSAKGSSPSLAARRTDSPAEASRLKESGTFPVPSDFSLDNQALLGTHAVPSERHTAEGAAPQEPQANAHIPTFTARPANSPGSHSLTGVELADGPASHGFMGIDLAASLRTASLKLEQGLHLEEFDDVEKQSAPAPGSRIRRWIVRGLIVLAAIIAVCLAAAAAAVLGPLIFEKIVLPLMEWQETHLSKPLLALVAVSCMAVLPVFILPTGPSMWVLGIAFDYVGGFCLIMLGAFFGQSLPYAFGHWLMHDRVQAWLSTNQRLTSVLRLADSGAWLQQFRTTLMLRMSPIPYPLFNYLITATKIRYGPYICASMVAMIPETFLAIYCGKLIQKLAMAHSDPLQRKITPFELAYELAGLCVSGSVVLVGMYHGHKAFKQLELQERAQRDGLELGGATTVDVGQEGEGVVPDAAGVGKGAQGVEAGETHAEHRGAFGQVGQGYTKLSRAGGDEAGPMQQLGQEVSGERLPAAAEGPSEGVEGQENGKGASVEDAAEGHRQSARRLFSKYERLDSSSAGIRV